MKALGPQDPRSIGEYRLVGRLGEGGMGQVYVARSSRGRTVALKLVLPELARQPEFRQRFRNEVDAARRIGGEWTAPVLDADLEAETPWVATGYVAGPSLHEVVAGGHGPLPERSVIALANGLTRALRDIHGASLIHRDLKPSNVLLTIDGPRVIDFGIARAAGDHSSALTRTGSVVGSPGFMSPEQCRGERLTPASDVFCLGSVLAFAATGRSPFGDQDSAMHVLMLRIIQDEKDLSGLSDRLHGLVSACLAPDPAARPALDDLLEHTADGDLWQYDPEGNPYGRPGVDPWLPAGLIAGLGRQAVGLLDSESPNAAPATGGFGAPSPYPPTAPAPPPPTGYAPTSVSPPGSPPAGAATAYAPTAYAPTAYAAPRQPAGHPATPTPGPARRSNTRPWLLAVGGLAVATVLAVVLSSLGGDDTGGDDPATPDAGDTAGADSGGDSGGGQNDDGGLINDEERTATGADNIHSLAGGETAEYTSGLAITVSPAEVVPESELPYSLDSGEQAYMFTVTVENRGDEPMDVSFSPEIRAGEAGVSADTISGSEFDLAIYGTVAPGRSLTSDFAASVPVDSGFLDVEYTSYAVTIWTLALP